MVGILFAKPTILYVVFLMFALWRWYQVLSSPVLVIAREDGELEFRGIIGRRKVRAEELTRVKRAGRGIYIEWPEGTANLYGNMEGGEELLEMVKRVNPEVELS